MKTFIRDQGTFQDDSYYIIIKPAPPAWQDVILGILEEIG